MRVIGLCQVPILTLLLAVISPAEAPYRLNRITDSAPLPNVDSSISAVEDKAHALHFVYTDGAPNNQWHIYYRKLAEDYWGIPINLSGGAGALASNFSPTIVFDPLTGNMFVIWLGQSHTGSVRTFQYLVEKLNPIDGTHTRVRTFDIGAASFRPKVVSMPGKVFILSEERPARTRTVFNLRVFLTASGNWLEKQFENTSTEAISSLTLSAGSGQMLLFWIRSTAEGHDVMFSTFADQANQWSEARRIFQSPALPEALSASAKGTFVSLAWTFRGGARNSILLNMISHDGGATWKPPGVFYSVGAYAAATMKVLSEKELLAMLYGTDGDNESIKFKYSVDGGQSFTPDNETGAISIGPSKGAKQARRPSFAVRANGELVLAWEEWTESAVNILFKQGPLRALRNAPRWSLRATASSADRYSYLPQLWTAGEKTYLTFGNKRRPQSVTEMITRSDLYFTELPPSPPVKNTPARVKRKR